MKPGRILLVDDQSTNLKLLERVLERAGYGDMKATTDPTRVLELMESFRPDIILLDLNMSPTDGFEVLNEIEPWIEAEGGYLPVLMLTADTAPATRKRALADGAKDFLTKPFDPIEVVLRVNNLLETRFLHLRLMKQNEGLEEQVRARTKDIWDAVNALEQSKQELRESRAETVYRLSIAAEYRDNETARHIQRVSRYCVLLARAAGWDKERIELIRLASQMHDIGKIGIPDRILLKQRPLTAEERKVMERHAEIGYRILADSDSALLRQAATIAYAHHEHFDGSGYPKGLDGHGIPEEGRVVAIADVYDALTSDRPYRKAFSVVETIKKMREGRGKHFDPELLDLFLGSMDEVIAIQEAHADRGDGRRVRIAR